MKTMSKGLIAKLYNCMCEAEAIQKDMTVGSGRNSYSAISEAGVLNVVKPLLKKHRLVVTPHDLEIKNYTTPYVTEYNGSKTTKFHSLDQLKVWWRIIDVDTGEYDIFCSPGNGADTQDKGSGKAWTYAYKALFQKTFCLFSGEDTDNTHSEEMTRQQNEPTEDQKTANWIKAVGQKKKIVENAGHNFLDLIVKLGVNSEKELEQIAPQSRLSIWKQIEIEIRNLRENK